MPYVTLPNGLRMHYREHGPGSRTVLLIHGNLASSRWWERVMADLPQGVRAIAPDLRCCGETAGWEGGWSMADLAADVFELTRALGIGTFTLVGHSLGGGVALELAAARAGAVERMVLINSNPADGLKLPAESYAQVEQFAQSPEVTKYALAAMLPTATKDEWYHLLMEDAASRERLAWLRNGLALREMDVTAAVGAIRVPVLVIYGARDPLITRAMAEATRDAIPGAALEVWEEIGHSAPAEAPGRLARRITAFMEGA